MWKNAEHGTKKKEGAKYFKKSWAMGNTERGSSSYLNKFQGR